MIFARRVLVTAVLLLVVLGTVLYVDYASVPTRNTDAAHFDVILVLGIPANPDGTPSAEQRERVLEGVREYRRGIAPKLMMTGGAAHNRFVEARVMGEFATSQGVPATDILEEGQAQNTIQNIYYSSKIMHEHGWRSAEIVSSPYHLGRTALILETFNRRQPALTVQWRTHRAPWPASYGFASKALLYSIEASRCLYIRLFGFQYSRYLPEGTGVSGVDSESGK